MRYNAEIKEKLMFEGLSLEPKKATYPLSEISVRTRLTKTLGLDIPILHFVPPNTDLQSMAHMASQGGMAVLSGELSKEQQVEGVRALKAIQPLVGAEVFPGEDMIDRVFAMAEAGLDIVFVRHAFAPQGNMAKAILQIRQEAPRHLQVVAGSVFTAEAARTLIEVGVDGLIVGCIYRGLNNLGLGGSDFENLREVVAECSISQTPCMFDARVVDAALLSKAVATGAETVVLGIPAVGVVDAMVSQLKQAIMYTGNNDIISFIQNTEFVQVK